MWKFENNNFYIAGTMIMAGIVDLISQSNQSRQHTMYHQLLPLALLCCLGCSPEKKTETAAQDKGDSKKLIKVVAEIPAPKGCLPDTFAQGSFSRYMQNLPLKDTNLILGFHGYPIRDRMYRVLAVVDMPLLFDDNLEQCADFAMRFWGEYHRANGTLSGLYLFNYHGKRINFNPQRISFRNFLRKAFANSNSYSLKTGCRKIAGEDVIPGDLIVQNRDGGIGHVSIIMNSCSNAGGDKYYLIGFSFMPAQEFHIENAMQFGKEGWFTLQGYYAYLRENLDLGEPVLRRF